MSRGAGVTIGAREVARRVLDRIDKDKAWATPALDGELARAGLEDRDRRLAAELVYGVLRHRRRLDRALAAHTKLGKTPPKVLTALRVAAYQLVFLDRVPHYAVIDDAVSAARALGGTPIAGFTNAVLRKLADGGEPALPESTDPLVRLEIAYSLPRWILDELSAACRDGVPTMTSVGDPGVRGAQAAAVAGTAAADAVAIADVVPVAVADAVIDARADVATAAAGAGEAAVTAAADAVQLASDATRPQAVTVTPGGRHAALTALAEAFARSAPIVARVNRLRATRDAVAAELEEAGVLSAPMAAAPMALRLEGLGDPARNVAFMAGRWTVQDTGAQCVAIAAAPRPGLRILDACAGVGGKSTHLAELIDDAGQIDAADLSATKLGLLAQTASRLGLRSIRTITCDLLDPAAPLAAAYDLIILDAPCSGLGVLRRHPDAKWRLQSADVPRLAQLQRQLLDAVLPRLAPGGALVYSVCTFTRAEGPEQIAALVARSGLTLVEEHRTWPPEADAFYLARLVRPLA